MLTKWDYRFFDLARLVSTWSKDASTQVGAVIVDHNQRIVSLGFNGFPKGIADTEQRLNDRELKYKMIIHAEENAILFANRSLEGCAAYVFPFPPCPSCMGKIIQSGITKIVCGNYIPDRWKDSFDLSFKLAAEANVEIVTIPVGTTDVHMPV